MPSTTYTDLVGPPVGATWLNEVNVMTFTTVPGILSGALPVPIAAGSIGTTKLADGSVTTQKIAAQAITPGKLADGAAVANIGIGGLTSLLYGEGSVTASALSSTAVISAMPDLGITTAKLAEGAVTTSKLADLGVTTAKLGNLSVTTGKLVDLSVTSAKLASGVAAANLGTGGVGTTLLAADSVTTEKFAPTAKAPFAGAADTATTATSATTATTAATAASATTAASADNALAISDGAVSTSAKIVNGIVTPAKLSQPYTLSTAVTTTTGVAIDFTGLPSWVKRITIMLAGVSTSSTSQMLVRLGTSGGIVATGYLGSAGLIAAAAASSALVTVGLGLESTGQLATSVRHGSVVITNVTGNQWVMTSLISHSNATSVYVSTASLALAAALTQVRVTTLNGTDTFDAGVINITYE